MKTIKAKKYIFIVLSLIFLISCGEIEIFSSLKKCNGCSKSISSALIELGTLSSSSVTKTSFIAKVNFTGDINSNASVRLSFCNESKNPNCSPTVDGISISMTKETNDYTAIISSLTSPSYTPGDIINIKVVATDQDGVEGDPSTEIALLSDWADSVDGSGYFEINTPVQFASIFEGCSATSQDSCNENFKLTSNIDLSGVEFHPIGGDGTSAPFNGNFDGQGKTISNLTIAEGSTSTNVGLFSKVTGTVKNLILDGANISGKTSVGSVVGYAQNATISNIISTNVTVSGNDNVGGLVGITTGSTVNDSYVTGDVTGESDVGGLVGFNWSSSVNNSYAVGNVSGDTNYIGGLIGLNWAGNVNNSFATGDVIGITYVGGLIGQSWGSSTVNNSYATGSVTGINGVGGLLGVNWNSPVNNSYATGNVSGEHESGGFVGLNFAGASVNNSFAIGTVSDCTASCGGFIGRNYSAAETDNYRFNDAPFEGGFGTLDTDPSNYFDPNPNFNMSWDFATIWTLNDGTFPTLQNMP